MVILLKSDQDQSQGLKKQKKGFFGFGALDKPKKHEDRQNKKRKLKNESVDSNDDHPIQNSGRQRRLTRQETPRSSSSSSQANSSMRTIKPSPSSSVSVSKKNQDKNQSTNKPKIFSTLFNFGSRRNIPTSNSKTRSKNITSDPSSLTPVLASEIKTKRPSSRRQSRQPIQALPLKSAQNTIVKRPPTTRTNSSVQLPPTLAESSQRVNSSKKNQRKPRKKPPSLFVYLIRLLILGIGIGAIIGTVLSIFDSNHSVLTGEPLPKKENSEQVKTTSLQPPSLEKELPSLKEQLKTLTDQYPDLGVGIFMVDLDSQGYIDVQAGTPFAAASTIKIPILMAFFQDVDDGKIHLDEKLVMEEDVIAGGSGDMQYQQVGKTFTSLETVTKMIVISDNTATNMIIKRLGGKEELNQRFQKWGLTATIIKNPLPDLEGTNTTSPKDLGNILGLVNQGDILSLKSRDRVLEIMRQTKTRTLLPEGLGEGASIAHKTGDIGTVLGDAGVIDMPNGKRYIASVLVSRPHNDIRGRTLIQEISRTIYDYLEKNPDHPTPVPTPLPTPTTSNN